MEPAAELLARLRLIRAVRFTSEQLATADTPVSGAGVVATSAPDADAVVFAESGRWADARGGTFRFHNACRWSRLGPTSLRLEQLRRGPAHPGTLVELHSGGRDENWWTSARPHRCGGDTYAAELRAGRLHLTLRWLITGPRKHERLTTVYAPLAPG